MRFVVAPMKDGTSTESSLRFLRKLRARVYTLTEMDLGQTDNVGLAQRVFGRLYHAYFNRDLGAHSAEIPLLLRRLGAKVLHFKLIPLSPAVPGGGVGNDRYLSVLRFRVWGRVWTVLGTHIDARIQNHDPKSPVYGNFFLNQRWYVTQKAVEIIENEIVEAKRVSDAILFGGDTNVLPVGEGLTHPNSPLVMLKRQGFARYYSRVTTVAVWGSTFRSVPTVYPPGKGGWGSDHAAVVAHVNRPKKRVR